MSACLWMLTASLVFVIPLLVAWIASKVSGDSMLGGPSFIGFLCFLVMWRIYYRVREHE